MSEGDFNEASTSDRPYMLRVMLSSDEKRVLFEAVRLSPALNDGHKMTMSHIARTAIVKHCKDMNIRAKRAKTET